MYEYRARIINIVDGDTLDVEIDLGFKIKFTERIRLEGINTPEIHGVKKDSEEYAAGMKAKERVEKLVSQYPYCTIITNKDKKGKYGRYIANIIFETNLGPVSVADILVQEGLAKEVTY